MNNFDKAKAILEYNKSVQPMLIDICAPLELFRLSNFSYTKITKDKRYFRIGNYQPWTDLIYKLDLVNHPLGCQGLATDETFSSEKQNKMFIWNSDHHELDNLRPNVNMWNGANIYCTNKEYFEVFSLGGTPQDTRIPDFLVNNMDILNRYFRYFKTAAKDIIDTTDRSKTIDITFHEPNADSYIAEEKTLDEFTRIIATNKHLVSEGNNKFSLSPREMDCLKYKNHGFTAKEIARLLNISHRTVESYFSDIKIKSGFKKINQILALCQRQGLL